MEISKSKAFFDENFARIFKKEFLKYALISKICVFMQASPSLARIETIEATDFELNIGLSIQQVPDECTTRSPT